jgi:lathosterol oxidase
VLEQKINEFFGDAESTGFGTGWWSGILSAFFGFLSFGAVLCLHFPQLLSSPELRPHYPMHTMRVLIQCLIVAAILFGIISSILRKKKILPLTGMLLAIAAAALGGSSVRINDNLHGGPAVGLDWFLLDLLLMALIYVPLERLWPHTGSTASGVVRLQARSKNRTRPPRKRILRLEPKRTGSTAPHATESRAKETARLPKR